MRLSGFVPAGVCPVLAVLCLAIAGIAQSAENAGRDPQLAALSAAIEKSRSEQVDVLAPRSFAAALENHQAAVKDAERGRNAERVRARVAEGRAALQRANDASTAVRKSLASVIKTREDAMTAQAPKFAPEAWKKAAERFRDAMAEHERGDVRNAQKRAAEAEVLLRDAELIAIKGGILNAARALIAQADEAEVGKFAPRSLQSAKRHLAEAEQEIQLNRYEVNVPRSLAAQAQYEARHALYLAQLIGRVREQESDDDAGLEALILSIEEPLRRIAEGMELSVQFDQGLQPPLQELTEQAQQQGQEARRLRQEVTDRDEQIAALNSQMQRLESRLGGVSEERVALQRRVDAQERLRANVASIESSFTPDQARVYRQGDDIVVSLLGIEFPSGRSTIDSGSAGLMQKVREALDLFPGASVSVQGHTDAHGSDSANLILSQDRADAVKQYLVSHFALDAEDVSSIGYGEARPLATNETAAGRARNRRIDLVIHAGSAR